MPDGQDVGLWDTIKNFGSALLTGQPGSYPAQDNPNAIIGPGAANMGGAGGFIDYTGDSPSGRRGDEVEDAADLCAYIAQGASANMVRAEARRRRFTRADYNAVFRVQSSAARVAEMLGLAPSTQGNMPGATFFQLVELLGRGLKGRRRRKRMMGLKTMLVAAHQLGQVAHAIKRAGHGIAALSRPVMVDHSFRAKRHQPTGRVLSHFGRN